MSWSDTHRYYRTLREIETALDRDRDGVVRWHPGYAAIFGSPAGLHLALQRRWRLLLEAQVEVLLDDGGRPARQVREVAAAHPGLLRYVARGAHPAWVDDLLGGRTRSVPVLAGAA